MGKHTGKKIGIVGCGQVGMTIAYSCVQAQLCDTLLLIGRNPIKVESEVLDLQGGIYCGVLESANVNPVHIYGGDSTDCKDVDILVFTAGSPPEEGQTRLDNLEKTETICKDIIPDIMKSGFNGMIIVVSNPVDLVTQMILDLSGLSKSQVIGTGTAIDTARLRMHVANVMEIKLANTMLEGVCLGEHGDSMVIPWSQVKVNHKAITLEDITQEQRTEIQQKVRKEGFTICHGKGKTNYGIAMNCVEIIKAISKKEQSKMVISTLLEGEYGVTGICMGVPVILTEYGVERIVELGLEEQELKAMQDSATVLQSMKL